MKVRFQPSARQVPEAQQAAKIPYAPAKRPLPRWRWYLTLALVTSPLIYLVSTAAYALLFLVAPGNVILKQYLLHATSSGYVKRLHAEIGGEVTVGQRLVDLVDPVLEERQTRFRSELASLKPSVSSRSPDLESVLMGQIRLAEDVVAQHRERLSTLQRLFAQGAATRGEVAEARGLVSQAEGDVNRARIELAEEQRRASSPGDWQLAGSQDRLRAELDVLAYQRSQLLQAAGYPGRVTDVYAVEGEFVTVGAKLMQIGLLTDPEIVVYVEPKHAQRLRPGSGASVTFPDGSVLGARVTARPFLTRRLPPEQVGSLGVRTISVVVTLAPETSWPKEQLIHGLPLEVRFHHGWEAEWRRAVVSVWPDPSGTPTALAARSIP
ncbi:MAG: HlyD family secretion protein [Gammaproteobacteria bacterium]